MRAAHLAGAHGDYAAAEASAREATAVVGAPLAEEASAWLTLEIFAGRAADITTRNRALAYRSEHAGEPTWRALLLVDRARMAAAAGEMDEAVALLERARAPESEASWSAAALLEQILHEHSSDPSLSRARIELHSTALET